MSEHKKKRILNLIVFLTIGWTLVLTGFYSWSIKSVFSRTYELSKYQAQAFFQDIVITRFWNAEHGGIYVPVTDRTQPNPYLKDQQRDVITTGGLKLTKINPAYMTRQIGELAEKRNQVWFHITSNSPIRPKNAPDKWESNILKTFESGLKDFAEFSESKTGEKVFRYMAPLWVEQVCLKCHLKQGYKKGDLRGGISVTIKAGPILRTQKDHIIKVTIIHISILALGVLVLLYGGYLQNKDITHIINIENQLRQEKEKLAVTLRSISEGVITTDLKGHVSLINAMAEKLTGWYQSEVHGTPMEKVLRIVSTKNKEACIDLVNIVLESKTIVKIPNENLLISRDNSVYNVAISAAPIKNETGFIIGVAIVFRDTTKEKQIEKEMVKMQKMSVIGTLTGGIAHDFNNIMGIILGNTELALNDVPESNQAHSNLKSIRMASLRAANIVRQLLSVSQRTHRKLRIIQISPVIKKSLKFLRSTIPITINIEQDIFVTNETILADPADINQIVTNLCINAFHAMEQTGGNLSVTVEKIVLDDLSAKDYPDLEKGNHVKVMVCDTGPGIDPEILDRIFDPYFTTKEVGKGSGLGLAVVHGIVKNNGGAIRVDSSPGKGTKFSILFPLVTEEPMVEGQTTQEIP
jgi:PAS domain S-box-containing protein